MKLALHISLFTGVSVVAIANALLWADTYHRNRSLDFSAFNQTYHLVSHRGALAITAFSNTPESDSYRTRRLPLWASEAIAILPLPLLLWRIKKARRGRSASGFPLYEHHSANP